MHGKLHHRMQLLPLKLKDAFWLLSAAVEFGVIAVPSSGERKG